MADRGDPVGQETSVPFKKARLESRWPSWEEEERWFAHMKLVGERHATRAIYENAANFLIEESGLHTQLSIEDEAVTMAIRSHGLICSGAAPIPNLACRMESFLSCPPGAPAAVGPPPGTPRPLQHHPAGGVGNTSDRPGGGVLSAPPLPAGSSATTPQHHLDEVCPSLLRDDILSQAVAVAIRKKGLATLDR